MSRFSRTESFATTTLRSTNSSPPPREAPEPGASTTLAPRAQQAEVGHAKPHDPLSRQQDGQRSTGPVLTRTYSTVSQRFKPSSSATNQSTFRRTLSMKKSTSVREGYWRIHDTADNNGGYREAVEHEEEEEEEEEEHKGSKKKKGKFRRACKKLFGF